MARFFVALGLSLCVLAIESGNAQAAPAEVKILSAAKWPQSYHGLTYMLHTYAIAVQNLAYDKSVVVVGQRSDGTWAAEAASYTGPMGGGYEKWQLETTSGFDTFAIRYDVLGRTYWDNNGGNNYTIVGTGVNLFQDINVLQADAAHPGSFVNIGVNVRDIAYAKNVYVVYTTDGWQTLRVQPLQWQPYQYFVYASVPSPNDAGIEYWWSHFEASGTIEYAISYDVDGATYWDNNYGANYVLQPQP